MELLKQIISVHKAPHSYVVVSDDLLYYFCVVYIAHGIDRLALLHLTVFMVLFVPRW